MDLFAGPFSFALLALPYCRLYPLPHHVFMMMVMMIYDGDETEDGEFEEAFCLRSGVWCLGVHLLTFFSPRN